MTVPEQKQKRRRGGVSVQKQPFNKPIFRTEGTGTDEP